MAEKSIFREAALERLSTPDRLDQGLTIVGSAGWIALGALVALIVGGTIWSLSIRVPITVAGSGIFLEPGGMLEVTTGSKGRVIVAVDSKYFRPAEVETLLGDPSRARSVLGWQARTGFKALVEEMVSEDLRTAERDALVRSHGHRTPDRHE